MSAESTLRTAQRFSARRRPRSRPRVLRGRSDEALVERIRAGDDRAFELVFDRYHRGVLAFCAHMLGSREEAEDALQHTFLAAYRSMRATGGEIRLRAWLYTIARNRCLSMLRARREEVVFDETRVATDGLAADVDRRAELRGLLADLERLPEDQRAALVLFELGDHAHDEIAEILGVRREKVKALVFQARESLASWRRARETPCVEIREQLATLRGAALKRATLRRHVATCDGCRAFEGEVRRQRKALAALLPIAPSAGLKATVLGSVLGGGGAAIAGGGSAAAGLGAAKGLAAKTMLCAAVAGSAGSAGYVAVHDLDSRMHTPPMHAGVTHHAKARHAAKRVAPTPQPAPATATIAAAATQVAPATAPAKAARAGKRHGFGRRDAAREQRPGKRGARGFDGRRDGDADRFGRGQRSGGHDGRGRGERRGAGKQLGGGRRFGGTGRGGERLGGKHGGGGQRFVSEQRFGGGQGRGGSRHAGVSPR